MCLSNVSFIAMENEDVNVIDSICGAEELEIGKSNQKDSSNEDFHDVFKGLDFDCPSELSSLSNEESDSPKVPEKQTRKHIVIGKHIEIVEGEQRKYKCTICQCQFTWKQQIRYHDYCVTGKRPLKCELCDKGFVKKSHFVYHMRTHTGESPFKCSFCPKKFKQSGKLKRHEKTHKESGNVEKFTCTVCGKDYSDRDSLRKHELKHDKTNNIKCKHCNKKYVDKFTLKQHLAAHQHPNFICDVCGKRFLRKNSLNIHMQIHDDVYPLQCSDCRKTFRTRKELTQHSVVHDKDNPGFECSICSIMCGRKDNLLRHVRNCHVNPCANKEQKTMATKDLKHDNQEQDDSKSGNIDGVQVATNNVSLVSDCSESSSKLIFNHSGLISMQDEEPSKFYETNALGGYVCRELSCNDKNCKIVSDTSSTNFWNVSINDLPLEGRVMTSSVHKNVVENSFEECRQRNHCKRQSLGVPALAPVEVPVDLSQSDTSNPQRESRELPICGQTSVIVHTSSFQEAFVHKANNHREPVIKFLRPSIDQTPFASDSR